MAFSTWKEDPEKEKNQIRWNRNLAFFPCSIVSLSLQIGSLAGVL